MILIAVALACCGIGTPRAGTSPTLADTVAVYEQIVSEVRAERKHGVPERVLLVEGQPNSGGGYGHSHGVAGKHSRELLREMVSRGLVDSVFTYRYGRTRSSSHVRAPKEIEKSSRRGRPAAARLLA